MPPDSPVTVPMGASLGARPVPVAMPRGALLPPPPPSLHYDQFSLWRGFGSGPSHSVRPLRGPMAPSEPLPRQTTPRYSPPRPATQFSRKLSSQKITQFNSVPRIILHPPFYGEERYPVREKTCSHYIFSYFRVQSKCSTGSTLPLISHGRVHYMGRDVFVAKY